MLKLAVAALAVESCAWLGYEFWRLLFQHGLMGAVDLGNRLRETHAWFSGLPVYGRIIPAVYPPATYALLWPFVGWLQFGAARWLWAAVSAAALACLAILLVRETGISSRLERAAVVLALLAMYPTGQTIGNGQLLVPVLPVLLVALLWIQRPARGFWQDALVALCLLLSLVKFPALLPFFAVAWFASWRKRPVSLALLAYGALTLLAASYQRVGLLRLLHEWSKVASAQAATHYTVDYANVQAWLGGAGMKAWIFPVSVAILVAFSYWAWRHRSADPWLLIGIAGYVARFWAYHRSYDDILIVLPMVALLRIAMGGDRARDRDVAAGVLLALTLAVLVVPEGLFFFPGPLRPVFTTLETVIWLAGLGFLLVEARASEIAAVGTADVARIGGRAAAVLVPRR